MLKHFRKVFRKVKILSMLEVSFYFISFHSYFSLSVKIIADESPFFLCMFGLHQTPTNTFECRIHKIVKTPFLPMSSSPQSVKTNL